MTKELFQAVKCYFSQNVQKFQRFKKHLHLSWKVVSGGLMISFSLVGAMFLFDPSMFSASLIQTEVYENQNKNVAENAEEYAGLLPDSPLYPVLEWVQDDVWSTEELTVLFAKVLKASQKNEMLAGEVYVQFLQALSTLSQAEQTKVLQSLEGNLYTLSVENPAFPYVYDVFALLDNETFWAAALVQYIHTDGNRSIVADRAHVIFDKLDQKNWGEKLKSGSLKNQLAFIKRSLTYEEIDGETVHAAAESWMLKNDLWKSL